MSEPFWTPLGGNTPSPLDPGLEVAYAEVTAPVAISGTTEAGATLIATAPQFTADGSSQYLVDVHVPAVAPSTTSAGELFLALFLDGVSLGTIAYVKNSGASAFQVPARGTRRITPAAGARTFSVRGYYIGGTGPANVYAGAGGAGVLLPGFIRVSKVPSGSPGGGGLVPPVSVVTALPASPVDGQKCILVDSLTAPTWQWNLQFLAAKATNKWIVLGATPLFDEVAASQTTASTTYVNLGTVGPQIQLPVAGDYMVRQGASMKIAGTSTTYYMSYDIGATAAVDADAVIALPGTAGDPGFSVMRSRKKLALGAVLLVAKYRVGAGAAAPFSNRWMEVEPIAVGG